MKQTTQTELEKDMKGIRASLRTTVNRIYKLKHKNIDTELQGELSDLYDELETIRCNSSLNLLKGDNKYNG